MLYYIPISPIIAIPVTFIVGIYFLINLLRLLSAQYKQRREKKKKKKEKDLIRQANIYLSAHNLFIPTKSTADPKWREASSKLNAEIRQKIKSGEIPKEEIDQLEKEWDEKYLRHSKNKPS